LASTSSIKVVKTEIKTDATMFAEEPKRT